MEEIFEFEGQEFTLAEVQAAAEAKSLSIDDYTKQYNISRKSGKITPPQEEQGATAEVIAAPELDVPSADSSLEYPGAKLEYVNALTDPLADKTEIAYNRFLINTADPIKGATTVAQEKAQKKYIENIQKEFDKGKFKKEEKKAYEKYKETGEIDDSLLPKAYVRPINPETLKPYTFKEYIGSSLDNVDVMLEKAADFRSGEGNIDIASASIASKLFGKEKIENWVAQDAIDGKTFFTSGLSEKELLEGIKRKEELDKKMKPTAKITEGIKEGDLGQTVAGLFNGVTQIYSSLSYAISSLGGPAAWFVDFYADNYVNANSIIAEKNNKSISEVIKNGEDDVWAPFVTAYTQSLAESFGLEQVIGKGLKKELGQKMTSILTGKPIDKVIKAQAAKEAGESVGVQALKGIKGEVPTELYQSGAEVYLKEITKTGDKLNSFIKATDYIFSEEGLEIALQSAAGGGFGRVASGQGSKLINAAKNVRASIDEKATEEYINKLSELNTKLKSTNDPDVIQSIKTQIEETHNQLNSLVTKANGIVEGMSEKDINEINNLDDLSKLQIERVKNLHAKKSKGEISDDEYLIALEGYKSSYIDAKNKIKGIISNVSKESNEAAQKVQKIYDEKGKDGIAEIIELYRPMAEKIAMKRKSVPGFDKELLTDEILTGKRGVLDLIQSFKPEENIGVPLPAYINKYINSRAIEASQRILKTDFELDVTEAKGVREETTAETQVEIQEEAKQDVRKALSEDLNLAEETQNEVITAVEKTLGTKLPPVTDKAFKPALTKGFRTELTNTFKKVFGRTDTYEQFLRDNFEKIYPAIPQETINKKFKEFNEPVLDPKTGKQLRERTAEGKKVFKKKDITKAEFIKYFLDAPGNVKGARKNSLAEVMADEIGLDNVLSALAKPEVLQKFKAIQEIQGQEVPSNFIEIISEKIDRVIEKLEAYQKQGVLRSATGIPEIIINSTIVFAKALKASIKAGKSFADALTEAIDKFKKSLAKKYSEEKLEEAEAIIRSRVTEQEIPDLLDLSSIIENVVAGKRGVAYEKQIIKALKDSKLPGLKIISKKAKGSDPTGFGDINIEYNGKIINIEAKLNADAQYSSIGYNFGKNKLSKKTSFDKKILSFINSKESSINKYIEKAKELGAEITDTGIKIDKEGHEVLKKEFGVIFGKFNLPIDLISELYNQKNVNYIQIGDAGLFYMGKDILNLGVPKFDGETQIEMRIKRDGNGRNSIVLSPKIPKWNQKSNKTLDTESGIQNAFSQPISKKSLNQQFNEDILQKSTGVKWTETFSPSKARLVGKGKGRKFFIPYSADDFVGLLYTTLAKGKTGDQQMQWYEENLLRPFSRGIQQYEAAKQKSMRDWMAIKKEAIKNVPGGLNKVNESGYTNQNSIRLYIWQKQGMTDLLGKSISSEEINDNLKAIKNNPKLKEFGDKLIALNPEGYPAPTESWDAGDITTDLISYVNSVKRKEFLTGWKENVKEIFSEQNMTKLQGLYGDRYVEALKNMLERMETGRNRYKGQGRLEKAFMDWTNNAVGTIMFFNARSAVLQTISAVNFINFTDNNPINAAIAFGNFPQYVNDFSTLFNSDFLKQRRSGLQTDINADEIANAAATSKNKAKAMLSAILKFGFTPTQIADSFAIASGGATFYRNRINKYIKDGLSKTEAEKKAFTDFQEIAEETQQSARPDRISMQQAGSLGRLILAFGNTPMQYARLTKKAALDLINGRGDWKTNISKIAYYSVIQNIIFSALQQGLFALLFDDEEEDKEKERYFRIANSSFDTLLRGTGVYGAAAATVKNMILEIIEQSKKSRPDYTQVAIESTAISPPINSKLRKLISAGKTFTYKQSKEKVFTEGLSLENPAFLAAGQVISAGTNIPADRIVLKADHLYTAMQPETELWQAIALSLGWSEWDLGMVEQQTKKSKKTLPKISVKRSGLKKDGLKRAPVKRK